MRSNVHGEAPDLEIDAVAQLAVAERVFESGDALALTELLRRIYPKDPDFAAISALVDIALTPNAPIPDLSPTSAMFAENLAAARKRWFDPGALGAATPRVTRRVADGVTNVLGEDHEVANWTVAQALNYLLLRTVKPSKRAGVVSAMRDDGLYVLEWIAHYQALGFDQIVIYSNDNADGSEALLRKLADHEVIIFVESEIRAGVRPEVKAFDHALYFIHELRECEWGLFIDSDEYLVPAAIYANQIGILLDAIDHLNSTRRISAVLYEWLWFNSGMIFERRPGLLMERFQYASPHWLTKPLARLCDLLTMRLQHVVELRADREIVNSLFQPIDVEKVWDRHPPEYAGGRINHYWPKSFQEFSLKKARGDALPIPTWDNEYRRAFTLFFQWNAPETPETHQAPDSGFVADVKRRCEALRNLDGVREREADVERRFEGLMDRYHDKGGLERIYSTLLKTTKWGVEAER